eukprot:scaffold1739_cov109-Cylindrotheca_fusiformis.AAC.2
MDSDESHRDLKIMKSGSNQDLNSTVAKHVRRLRLEPATEEKWLEYIQAEVTKGEDKDSLLFIFKKYLALCFLVSLMRSF